MAERTLPQSKEAERAVLGILLLDSTAMLEVAGRLHKSDFYYLNHGRLFALMVEMAENDEPVELVSVVQRLTASRGELEEGELTYITGLPDDVPSTLNVLYYADIVANTAQKRRLLAGLAEAVDGIYRSEEPYSADVKRVEETIRRVESASQDDWIAMEQDMGEAWTRATAPPEEADSVVSTGLHGLDAMLRGFGRGELIVLAGRPGSGKTLIADQLAVNVARQGFPVGLLSLEMGRGELADRRLCAEARVDNQRLAAFRARTGPLTRAEWCALRHASETLKRLPLYVQDPTGLDMVGVRRAIRRLKAKHPDLRLVVTDYIGLIVGGEGRERHEKVASNVRACKAVAREEGLTFLLLSQLNRKVEERPDKRPLMSDIRETGEVEQTADRIITAYRDDYYNPRSTQKGVTELNVLKNRSGRTGVVRLYTSLELSRIDDILPLGGAQ